MTVQTISEDGSGRLVFRVRSPLPNAVGGLGLFFLIWLAIHWWTHHPNRDHTIGLIGASITCLLFMLVSEKSDFVFESGTRRLTWTRRVGFLRRSGQVPFEEIEHVVVRTVLGSDSVAPSQRIVLLTRQGELPLTAGYSPGDDYAENAERLRTFLGRTKVDPVSASVAALVAAGRDVDAIRELRLTRGLSLTDARSEVERIRRENGGSGS